MQESATFIRVVEKCIPLKQAANMTSTRLKFSLRSHSVPLPEHFIFKQPRAKGKNSSLNTKTKLPAFSLIWQANPRQAAVKKFHNHTCRLWTQMHNTRQYLGRRIKKQREKIKASYLFQC